MKKKKTERQKPYINNSKVKHVKMIVRVPEPLRDQLKREAWLCRMSLTAYLMELWDRRKDDFDQIKYIRDLEAAKDNS